MICETFLHRLSFGNTENISPVVGTLSTMMVNKSGLGLLNTVTSYQENYLSSTRGSAELVRAVTGEGAFSNADHLWNLSEERRDRKKDRDVVYEYRLKGSVRNIKVTDKLLLILAKSTGVCLSVRGTTVSGTVLSAT